MTDLSFVRSVGFRTDLMLLVLQDSEVTRTANYAVVRTPSNPTFWWGNFLLYPRGPEPGEPQQWVDDFEREFPDAGHIAIGLDTDDADRVADEWLALGLTIERATALATSRTVPPPRPNTEADYRPFGSDADWAAGVELAWAQVDDADASASTREFTERRMASLRRLHEQGHGVWFGAFLADRLVSSLGVFTDGTGLVRYQNVDTHPDFRNRGLAGSLVHEAGLYARAHLGAARLVIVADPDYLAYRIYERVGFSAVGTQVQLQRSGRGSVGESERAAVRS